MNRHKRRAAKKRIADVIVVDYGHLLEGDQRYGLSVSCYVCGAPHRAFGFARIRNAQEADCQGHDMFALCGSCLASEGDDVFRIFLNKPTMKVADGGKATPEQVMAMVEKQDAMEH